jgi:hypothetical protein
MPLRSQTQFKIADKLPLSLYWFEQENHLMPATSPLLVEKDVTPLHRKPCSASEPSLSWLCAFCGKLRIWDGGRPGISDHCKWCSMCDSSVVFDSKYQEAIIAAIDQNLL